MDYKKMSYKNAMAFIKAMSTHERSAFQQNLYEKYCAKEIEQIPDNIKEHCVICGKRLKMTSKRYEKYGNYCMECDLKITIQMSIEKGLFKSHRRLP